MSTVVKKTLYITTKPQALQLLHEVNLDKLCETYSKENLQYRWKSILLMELSFTLFLTYPETISPCILHVCLDLQCT